MKRKTDNVEIFELALHTPTDAEINGIFYVKGLNFPIIATKSFLDLNTNKFIGNTLAKKGTGIGIDKDFMAI